MIKPNGNKIAIITENKEETTSAGLILPDGAGNDVKFGEVVAVGDGIYQNATLIPVRIKVGQIVAYPKFSITELKIDGKVYNMVDENQIIAVVGGKE